MMMYITFPHFHARFLCPPETLKESHDKYYIGRGSIHIMYEETHDDDNDELMGLYNSATDNHEHIFQTDGLPRGLSAV